MTRRIGYRHCDPRWPFLWHTAQQPAARWHGEGEGPANYFADTPTGAWAEFLRHEEITEAFDLAGVRRSLWAVELPDFVAAEPALARRVATGGPDSHAECQREARRLRARGATALQAPSAALQPLAAGGWRSTPQGLASAEPGRDGLVWVVFGPCEASGWPAVDGGAPPAAALAVVRHLPW